MKASLACLLAAGLVGPALQAAPYSGPTGIVRIPVFLGRDKPPEPRPVRVIYDQKRGKYCVTKVAFTGSRIAPTHCRTAAAWNASGELQEPVG